MSPNQPKSLYLEIFATAFSAILLEIAYTRVFSFKVFYYFTYLIIGLGLLGIGGGGILLAVSDRLRRADPARLIPALCFIGAASIAAGFFVIAPITLNASRLVSEPFEVVKLVGICLILTVPFLCVGTIISLILGLAPGGSVGRLYATDLLGAALACLVVVPLLWTLDPPRTILLSALTLAVGGLRLAASRLRLVGVGLSIFLAATLLAPSLYPSVIVDDGKGFEQFKKSDLIRFSKWNPVFRVDVASHPFEPDDLFLLFHDGQPGSGLRRFDGSFGPFAYLRTDSRSLPFVVAKKNPKVLIIGSAGGHEVVASLFFEAEHVTGVELNKVTLSLLTDHFADLTGHLADHPKVTLINGDGRWFLHQTEEKFDMIWFVAPDSYAAMNAATSGAFVLSESYLYTVEMIQQGLRHLTPEGIICAQFGEIAYDRKPNRTARYLATARAAFAEEGIPRFQDHVMVGRADGFPPFHESVVVISRAPFDQPQRHGFLTQAGIVKGGSVPYIPGGSDGSTPVQQVIMMPDEQLAGWFAEHPYMVDPVRDDSPFFWHFVRYRDAIGSRLVLEGGLVDYEDTIGEKITLIFLGTAVVLAAVLLLLPLVAIRRAWVEMPHKLLAAVYFACLGLGFMFIEVALIQNLTLLLGYPTYSLSVTLFAILVFSGFGSLLSGGRSEGGRHSIGVVLACLAVVLGLYHFALPAIVETFLGSALPLRIGITIVLIAPIGLCLGAFMPAGLATIAGLSSHPREYMAWAWAVNGFFSVIASILSTILGMAIGFRLLMLSALVIYAIGTLALQRLSRSAR